jgi:hypothetical protein
VGFGLRLKPEPDGAEAAPVATAETAPLKREPQAQEPAAKVVDFGAFRRRSEEEPEA